jgi:hypothetical protein
MKANRGILKPFLTNGLSKLGDDRHRFTQPTDGPGEI